MAQSVDLSRLAFHGNPFCDDTFCLAMAAVARQLGKPVDYERLCVVAGNVFAPDIRPDEADKSCWHVQGRGRNIDLVCSWLGLTLRPFVYSPLPGGVPPRPENREALQEWERLYWRQPNAWVIRDALSRGEFLVSMGEWGGRDVLWTEWGLILSATDEGVIKGLTSNGRPDNPVDLVRDGWIVGSAEGGPTLSDEALDAEILRRAAARIRGGGERPLEPGDRRIRFGLPAIDAWAAQFSVVPFCSQCGDGSWQCATYVAASTIAGSRLAARYLADCAGRASDMRAEGLVRAVGHFEAIAELLSPAVAEAGRGSYRTIMGDVRAQQQHVEKVLTPVREALAGAGEAIAAAIPQT